MQVRYISINKPKRGALERVKIQSDIIEYNESNFSSRNVIIPDPTLRDDQIDLSYHTFLELYKFKIIYYLMKMEDISLSKAYYKWSRAYKFDNQIYEIMQFIVKKEKPKVLINRNPTLNYYSMLLMSVRRVKKDINDYTLSVPLSVLPGQAAHSLIYAGKRCA